MKRIYVNEKWCLGCHLCEYYCAYANSGKDSMVNALKNVKINPRIQVEEGEGINFAVSCRHCKDPLCVKSCITGALTIENGVISFNHDKCVGCYTCILSCPYGCKMLEAKKCMAIFHRRSRKRSTIFFRSLQKMRISVSFMKNGAAWNG